MIQYDKFTLVRVDREVYGIITSKVLPLESRNDALRRMMGLPPLKKDRSGRPKGKRQKVTV